MAACHGGARPGGCVAKSPLCTSVDSDWPPSTTARSARAIRAKKSRCVPPRACLPPPDDDRWPDGPSAASAAARGDAVAHASLPTRTARHPDTLPAWTRGDRWHRGHPTVLHGGKSAAWDDNRVGQDSRDTCAHQAALLGRTKTLRARRLSHPGYPAIPSMLRYTSAIRSTSKKSKERRNTRWSSDISLSLEG